VPDHGSGQHPLALRDQTDAVGEGLDPGDGGKRRRASVAGQIRNEQAMPPSQ